MVRGSRFPLPRTRPVCRDSVAALLGERGDGGPAVLNVSQCPSVLPSGLKIIAMLKKIFSFLRSIISGLVPASWEFQRAIRLARRKYAKTGHRFFLIWNPDNRRLEALSYEALPGRMDSYIALRHRGRFSPLTRRQFQEGAFFFTASRNGAPEMDQARVYQRLEVLRSRYYTRSAPVPGGSPSGSANL